MAAPKFHRRPWVSLPGALIITNLAGLVGVTVGQPFLADAGGVIHVDASNQFLVDAREFVTFFLLSPLFVFLAPRRCESIFSNFALVLANAALIGYGFSGLLRILRLAPSMLACGIMVGAVETWRFWQTQSESDRFISLGLTIGLTMLAGAATYDLCARCTDGRDA